MQAPPIDKRDYQALVAETTELARTYSIWQPRADLAPDAGLALIRIFGRFAELVVQRINRAPDKNYLAFLNLIGTHMLPPQPARAPLTFALAEGSPVTALVSAGTQVAAPPLEGEEDEIVFETEGNLVVTRAKLKAVFVSDPETDTYSDRTLEATGQLDAPFAAFEGHQPIPHQLFIACDQILAQPGAKAITLVLQSPDTAQWASWKFAWSYWDGAAWSVLMPTSTVSNGAWRVAFAQLPEVSKTTINDIEAGWLRVQLDTALSPGAANLAPDSMAVGNRRPEDFPAQSASFGPFGDAKDSPAKFFYFSADEALGSGGARARLQVSLARAGVGANVKLNWSYKVGSDWQPLGTSSAKAASAGASDFGLSDGTQAFTRNGEIGFNVPGGWTREFFRSRIGRWLRVEVADDGPYSTLPQIKSLTVSYGWELPRINSVAVVLSEPPAAAPKVLSDVAFFNNGIIDLTKDFYPFGEQPRFNDTWYLSLPDSQAQPGSVITVQIEVTDPTIVTTDIAKKTYTDGRPQIVWEASDGKTWREMARFGYANPTAPKTNQSPSDETNAFTANGNVLLTLPASMAPAVVNNEERCWLRARLISGEYGKAAVYMPGPPITYNPATFTPPSIKSVSFKPVGTRSATAVLAAPATSGEAARPPVLCLSHNNFVYQDLLPMLVKGQLVTPFVPTSDPDPALYLGFDLPFEARPVTLYLQVEPPLPEEVAADELAEMDPTTLAQVVWEYAPTSSPNSWRALGAIDETQALANRGLTQFVGPPDFATRACFGQTRYWVRLRWQRGYFPITPRLRRILPNTVWASQVSSSSNEILGSSNGNPSQVFVTAQQPVQAGQQVWVREREHPTAEEAAALIALEGADAIAVTRDAADQPDEIWVRWHAVSDFYDSGPRDRHYSVDALTGEVRFGDGQFGLVPPQGQNNLRTSYRTGGGESGNRAAQTIAQLKSGVPYIDSVTNYEPAGGGAPREPLERLKARGPRTLRHRDRVIAAQDLEDLAYEASADVARAAAVMPAFDPYNLWLDPKSAAPPANDAAKYEQVNAGRMGVIVVPNAQAAQPTPSLSLLRQVEAHLQQRCPPTADLWVAGPEWVQVKVTTTVVPASLEMADAVSNRVQTALEKFLHPLTGGPKGEGWAFGRKPHRSDLFAVVEAVEGVDHVRTLAVALEPESKELGDRLKAVLNQSLAQANQQTPAQELRQWLGRALVYSGPHEVVLAWESV